MDRREFLISTGGGAAAAALTSSAAMARPMGGEIIAAPSIATKRHTLACSMPWQDNGRGFGDQARRLALRISEATDGRITMTFADAEDAADAAHVPAYLQAAGAMVGDAQALAYFAGLPGAAGLPIHDHLAWLSVGGGQMLWDDLAQDRGVKPLAVGHSGERGLLWSKAPVDQLAAFGGRKIAIMGSGADVARGLGLEPVAVSETRDAQDADFLEAGGAFQALSLDVHRTHSYALEGGLGGGGTLLALEIELEVWDAMHAGDRARLALAAEAELQASLSEARAHEVMVRGLIASSFGVKIVPMPLEIRAARDRVAEAVVAHIAAAGPKAQRIDQSFRAFKGLLGEAVA